MITRLKFVAQLVTSCCDEGSRPLIGLEHIESGTGRLLTDSELQEINAPEIGSAAVEVGDVLFGKLRPYLAKTWLADRPVFASTELLCLRPRFFSIDRWLAYVLASHPVIEWAVATCDGTKMPRTSWEKLGDYNVKIPSITKQIEIASYLDRETARIDSLIDKKRQLVKLLKERRQVIITEAVTGKLDIQGAPKGDGETHETVSTNRSIKPETAVTENPRTIPGVVSRNCSMDQGPWPAATLVRLLKYFVETQLGKMLQPKTKSPEDFEVPYLSAGSLSILDMSDLPTMFAKDEELRVYNIRNEDLVVVEGGDVGRVELVQSLQNRMTIIQNSLHRLRSHEEQNLRFIKYCLTSIYGSGWLEVLCNKATFGHLTQEKLRSLPIPHQSPNMQRSIADFLDSETSRIDALVEKIETQIKLFSEQRQALITAAVTGELEIAEMNS